MSVWWKDYPTYRDQILRAKELQEKMAPTDEERSDYIEMLGHLSIVYGSAQMVSTLLQHPELAEF